MAYVLSQMPVHYSTGQLLKEPDVLPKLTCLFEKEIVHETIEKAKESNYVEPQEKNGEELMIANCEVSEIACIIKLQDDSTEDREKKEIVIDIVSCEDQEMAFDVKSKASNDIGTQTNSVPSELFQINSELEANGNEDQFVDIISCEDVEEAIVTSNAGTVQNKPKLREFFIPLQKLRVSTNCVNKKPEVEEDEYIFCNHCDKLRIGDCSFHGGLRWIKEPTAVIEKDGLTRARSTIPSSMDLKISSIPDAGLGIFAKERFEADVVFGPYWGDKIDVADLKANMDQSYMWDIIESGRVTHVVDARGEEHSNWLRFVNCARNEDEQNLVAFQFRGEIYYRSFKTIEPGMELLVWYGDKYACDLAILDKDTTRKMEDGPIQCQKCFVVCSGPVSFSNHNKFRCQLNNDHHLWRCIHCDRSFKDQKRLHFHKYIHKGVKPFTCGVCGRVFAFKSSKDRHHKQMHSAVTSNCRCSMCSNVFNNKNKLWQHERTVHAVKRLSDGSFECLKCQKRFTRLVNLQRHMKQKAHSDSKEFSCKTCGKVFKKKENLVRHEALHKPSGPFTCSKCGKFCLSRNDLRKHMLHNHAKVDASKDVEGSKHDKDVNVRKVSSEKRKVRDTFHCHICKKEFLYSYTYSKHMREKHPRFKIVRCGICSKVCNDKRRLALHMAIRHPKKSKSSAKLKPIISESKGKASSGMHRCDLCPKEFMLLESLTAHSGHHSRRKVLDSQRSGKKRPSFNGKSSSKLGLTSAFNCEVCNKSFETWTSLRSHVAYHRRSPSQTLSCSRQGRSSTRNIAGSTFSCKVCNRSFESWTSLRSHFAHHSRRPSQSGDKSFCELLTSSSSQGKPPPRSTANSAFDFRICNKSFKSVKALGCSSTHHCRSPSQKSLKSLPGFTCGAFPLSSSSQVRQKNPQPSKELSNSQLVPGSKNSVSLVSPSKQFICEICGKGFHLKKTLGHHRGHHLRKSTKQSSPSHLSSREIKPVAENSMQKKHERDACILPFKSSNSLSQHKEEHTRMANARVSSVCRREFSSKLALVHYKLRNHGNRRMFYQHGKRSTSQSKSKTIDASKFKCRHCAKHFVTYSGLSKHMRKLHVDFSFSSQSSKSKVKATSVTRKCRYCSSEFLTASGLRKHLRNKHPKQMHDLNDECRPARIDEFKTTTVNKKQCRGCKVTFFSSQGAKRSYCMRCCRNLKRTGESTGPPSRQSSINSSIQKSIRRKRNLKHLSMSFEKRSMRAFQCYYCQEGCSTINSLFKHIMVVHRNDYGSNPTGSRRLLDDLSENKAENKTSNLQTKTCLWSCQYCIKQLQTESGLRRHVKNIHGKKLRVSNQRTKLKKNNNCNETNDSNMAEPTRVCRLCNVNFSCNKSLDCFSCSEKLLSQKRASSSQTKERRSRPHRSTTLSIRNAVGAFKCLYCRKGFSTINSLYKHMVIAHRNDFSKRSHSPKNSNSIQCVPTNFAPRKCEDCGKRFQSSSGFTRHVANKHSKKRRSSMDRESKSEGKCNSKVNSPELAKVPKPPLPITASETISDCEKGNAPLSAQLSSATKEMSETFANKLLRKRTKRTNLTCRFKCRQCGKTFASNSGRWRHMNAMHKKKNDLCEGVLSAFQNFKQKSKGRAFTNGSQPKGKYSRYLAFPCEYCPLKFSCLGDRFKHVMLVHSRKNIPSPSKVYQLKLDTSFESSATSDAKSFCHQDCDCFNGKVPNASSDRQQEHVEARWLNRRSKGELNGFVSNLKDTMSADRSLDSSAALKTVTSVETQSKIHDGKSSNQLNSSSLGDVHQSHSFANHCTDVLPALVVDGSPYKCGIDCDSSSTKRKLLEHSNKGRNGNALSCINGLSRPALRNITCLQNSNKVCC